MEPIEKVNNYLSGAEFFSLSTVDGDHPKCRPIAFHLLLDNTIYFGIGTFKDVYKQLSVNPNAEICACNGTDFMRYYGKAFFENDSRIADMVLSKAPAMQKIYNDSTGYKLGIFHLGNSTAEFRSKMGIVESYSF